MDVQTDDVTGVHEWFLSETTARGHYHNLVQLLEALQPHGALRRSVRRA